MITNEIVPLIKNDNRIKELQSLNSLLTTLYPENRPEDKEILTVKKILGEKGSAMSYEEIKDLIAKVQYLIDSMLNQFERKLYKGKTLQELLSSKKV